MTNPIHPELRAGVRFIPKIPFMKSTLFFMRWLTPFVMRARTLPGVHMEERSVGGMAVRMHSPEGRQAGSPALLWLHGGGHLLGTPAMDDAACARYARDMNMLVVAPDYRLAPENPFPADLDDCFSVLRWMMDSARELGIDASRIVIGGASAGGGLAAALVQRVHDENLLRPAFQLLIYPMLDDRTTRRDDINEAGFRFWHQADNRYAWNAYLRGRAGAQELPAFAAPARRTDLSGLPPAWIGVGSLDLFRDENRDYANRLGRHGVECSFHEIVGAYHGFDMWDPGAPPSRAFYASQVAAMRKALNPCGD